MVLGKLAATTAFVVLLCCSCFGAADEASHTYADGENVIIWLNKIGPFHNPSEAFRYYNLPYCRPSVELEPRSKWAGLAEVFDGMEYINSDLPAPFKQNIPPTASCSVTLTEKTAEYFAYAVSNHYWYQIEIDDLPVWGMVGEVVAPEETIRLIEQHTEQPHDIADSTYLFTHKRFSIGFNGDRVIEVNLTSENAREIVPGRTYEFTYSIDWVPMETEFDQRFNRYLDYNFFEHQIHWFSIYNSFMMVIFLCGVVGLILVRTLLRDFAKYKREDDDLDSLDKGMPDDSGWKQVHGEVFRRPPYLIAYSAIIGTGYQLICLVLFVILASFYGNLYMSDRGSTATAVIAIYSLTAVVAGYTSGAYYRSHFYPDQSPFWTRTMFVTSAMFPGMVFVTLLCLNFISLSYGTINSIPFSIIVALIFVWLFVSLPLVVGGTILGRRWSGKASFPCRVNSVPRPIPPRKWYMQPLGVCMLTGLLPFGSIFIEMYYVFTAFWNYKFYYVYGFMLLVYFILAIVTSCVTIVAVYCLLNSEDYRWPWLSFLASGSTAVYVFAYSCYYFFFKTSMTGLLQTAFYFTYMGLFCTALALVCGTIGFTAASVFVRRIYQNIKVD